ncbi:hypothetical protein BHM03_00021361 [Ensete ventricosum]|nr:hypothetical protein BHM03_00021361 [Ensete ventricosum]
MERERWMAMATLVGLICDVYLVTVSADVGTATSYDPPYLRKTFSFFFLVVVVVFTVHLTWLGLHWCSDEMPRLHRGSTAGEWAFRGSRQRHVGQRRCLRQKVPAPVPQRPQAAVQGRLHRRRSGGFLQTQPVSFDPHLVEQSLRRCF